MSRQDSSLLLKSQLITEIIIFVVKSGARTNLIKHRELSTVYSYSTTLTIVIRTFTNQTICGFQSYLFQVPTLRSNPHSSNTLGSKVSVATTNTLAPPLHLSFSPFTTFQSAMSTPLHPSPPPSVKF